MFRFDFRLDMPLGSAFRKVGDWLLRVAPRYVRIPLVGLGSPLSDRCALNFDPELDQEGRRCALAGLLDDLMARAEATGADLLAIKDLPNDLAREADPLLAARGYTRVASLPVALLDLPFTSEADYLASLKPSVRADLRRKLRQSGDSVRLVLHENTASTDSLCAHVERFYEQARGRSKADYGNFDALSPGFVANMLRTMGTRARLVTSWVGDELAGFSLFLLHHDRAVAFKIGLDGALARQHNLYFLNWMWMVRYCIERRIQLLEMGQTTYALKVRLGCRLEPSWIYFRHRRRGWNRVFQFVGPHVSFASMDPDLKRMKYRPDLQGDGSEPSPHLPAPRPAARAVDHPSGYQPTSAEKATQSS